MGDRRHVKECVLFLTKPSVVFYTLIWLIVLLLLGTVAQKYIGLYRAQQMFFSSWIVWWGPVPLPGGLPTLGVLSLGLTLKLCFASRWSWQHSGTIVTHIGALLLLYGGLVTYLFAQEGSMTIYEGERSYNVSDYHIREFVVEDRQSGHVLMTLPWETLKEGEVFAVPGLPVRIEIVKLCQNCNISPRSVPEDDPSLVEFRGMARRMDISPLPLEKEDEQNRGAVQFRISGSGEEKDGIHFSADFIDISPQIALEGKTYNLALRKKQTRLPFEIELIDFEKQVYPGTDKPKSYHSEIILRENGSEWRSVIRMNEPLRYRGYTFYQSSFIDNGKQQATVLAVVKNAGRMFPYIASIVMCIGILIHVILRLPILLRKPKVGKKVKNAMVAAICLASLDWTHPAHAAIYNEHLETFAHIPVLDQGRVKPMDSFARSYLEIISGRDSVGETPAIAWLAELLMDPDQAYLRPVISIANPAVTDALELERRKTHRYSYKEVTTAFYHHAKSWHMLFSMPEEQMSLPQKQMLELYNKTQILAEISRSLSLLFPEFTLPEGLLAEGMGMPPGSVVTFLQLRGQQPIIDTLSKEILEKSKDESYAPSSVDLMLTRIAIRMKELGRDRSSQILRMIPPQWQTGEENNPQKGWWFSPWGIGLYGQGSPESAQFLTMLGELVQAYQAGNHTKWNDLTTTLRQTSLQMVNQPGLEHLLDLEVMFNNTQPFRVSFGFYLLSLLVVMASFLFWHEPLRRVAFSLLLAGFLFHVTGLGVRMYLMQRPPVTNLYESIIFVSLITALFGMILERRLKNALGILIATSLGTLLHFLGMKFDAEGDTMGMLVAVLDTNFWLATHVVTITIGYGCSLVGGVLGHVYLIQRIARPKNREALSGLARNIRGVVFVALLFTTIGTILGGIWADQSWGRFWGWDPKENGALLLVLWLVLLIHGRLSGIMGELGFAVGMVCANIIVAMAWFGVNLLSVGLHSYGFTEGAAKGFVIFCLTEFIIAMGAYTLIKIREYRVT